MAHGTTSAPYLAMRCLKELAEQGQKDYSLASMAIKDNLYMDAILTGSFESE